MEDLKQTPPASVESDAPSEYMRGYSDGLETIAAAILAARIDERRACAAVCQRQAEYADDGWGDGAKACFDNIMYRFDDENAR